MHSKMEHGSQVVETTMVSSVLSSQLIHRISTGVNVSRKILNVLSSLPMSIKAASLGLNLVSDSGQKGCAHKRSQQGRYVKYIFQCFPFCKQGTFCS